MRQREVVALLVYIAIGTVGVMAIAFSSLPALWAQVWAGVLLIPFALFVVHQRRR